MKKIFGAFVALAVFLVVALPLLQGQSWSKWAPAITVGGGSYTEIVLKNETDRDRYLVLSFFQEGDSPDHSPYMPASLNRSLAKNFHKIVLGSRQERVFVVSRPGTDFRQGWAEISIDYEIVGAFYEPRGPVQSLTGRVVRVMDGREYESDLSGDTERIDLKIVDNSYDEDRVTTAIAVVNPNQWIFPWPVAGVTYELVNSNGEIIARVPWVQYPMTQTSQFVWQIFCQSSTEWFKLVGPQFEGKLRLTMVGAPVAAVSVQVPY